MSFGFSVGDFLAVGNLIKDICHCLRNGKGSAAEYQELLRELDCLQQALCHLDKLRNGNSIQKYESSLGIWSKDGTIKSTINKLRWGFSEKEEVRKLQSYINIHIGTINILLAEYGLEKLDLATKRTAADQLDIQERLSQTHDIIKKCSSSLAAQTMVVRSTHSMLVRLCDMICGEFRSSWNALEDMVAKVCVSTQQIYTVLIEIKTSLAGPDIRWTYFQAPFLVEDALGHKFPVPSEYDFDLLDAVVKHKFSSGPGSAEVYDGNYEYIKTKDSNAVISKTSRLFPGMAITMAIIVIGPMSTSDTCPTIGCSSVSTSQTTDGSRTCPECSVRFSTTDRKLKTLRDLILASSVMSRTSAAESQPTIVMNPRKRAASPPAKEDEPPFKNIRLSLDRPITKDNLNSSLPFTKGSEALSNSASSGDAYPGPPRSNYVDQPIQTYTYVDQGIQTQDSEVDNLLTHLDHVDDHDKEYPGLHKRYVDILMDKTDPFDIRSRVKHLFRDLPDLFDEFEMLITDRSSSSADQQGVAEESLGVATSYITLFRDMNRGSQMK